MAFTASGDGTLNAGGEAYAGRTTNNSSLVITSGAYTVTTLQVATPDAASSPTVGTVTLDSANTDVTVNDGQTYAVSQTTVGVDPNGGSSGYLNVENGASLTAVTNGVYNSAYGQVLGGYNTLVVGSGSGTQGAVTVDGTGTNYLGLLERSRIVLQGESNQVVVGQNNGSGTLSIFSGALVSTLRADFGSTGGNGMLVVSGAGSEFTASSAAGGFADPGAYRYQAAIVKFGSYGGGTGDLIVEDGALLRVENSTGVPGDPSDDTGSPGLIFGEGRFDTGFGLITGTGTRLEVIQNGPTPSGHGGISGIYVGVAGYAYLSFEDNSDGAIYGDRARIFVGQGGYDFGGGGYGIPNTDPGGGKLSISGGANVLVSSLGYGSGNYGAYDSGSLVSIGERREARGEVVVTGENFSDSTDRSSLIVTSSSNDIQDYTTGLLTVGTLGTGYLTVSNQGLVQARELRVGDQAAFVAPDNSTSSLVFGYSAIRPDAGGSGYVYLSSGADVVLESLSNSPNRGLRLGAATGTYGRVYLSDEGTSLTSRGGTGQVVIGQYGRGELRVQSGSDLYGFSFAVGSGRGGSGELIVDGLGSTVTSSDAYGQFTNAYTGTGFGQGGRFEIGRSYSGSSGYVSIQNGGQINVINDPTGGYDGPLVHVGLSDFYAGYGSRIATYGRLIIDGEVADASSPTGFTSSALNIVQTGYIGDASQYFDNPRLVTGNSNITVQNNGQINVLGAGAFLGNQAASDYGPITSRLVIQSGGDVLIDSQSYGGALRFSDGYGGYRYVNQGSGAAIGSGAGYGSPVTGYVSVDGIGSTFKVTSQSQYYGDYGNGNLSISNGGDGTLDVSNGGEVESRSLTVGGGYGTQYGTGTVNISSGGRLKSVASLQTPGEGIFVGSNTLSTGIINVDGAGSQIISTGELDSSGRPGTRGQFQIGSNGYGSLSITNDGFAAGAAIEIGVGYASTGVVIVDGLGSTLEVSNYYGRGFYDGPTLQIASFNSNSASQTGSLSITGGGQVNVYNSAYYGNYNVRAFVGAGYNNRGQATVVIDGRVADGSSPTGYTSSQLNITETSGAYSNTQAELQIGNADIEIRNEGQLNVSGGFARVTDGFTADPLSSEIRILSGGDLLVSGSDPNYLGGTTSRFEVGNNQNNDGGVVVDGIGSTLTVETTTANSNTFDAEIRIGQDGTGSLDVSNGGLVSSRGFRAGTGDYGVGTVNVTNGGVIEVTGVSTALYQGLRIGDGGRGYLSIDGDGSRVTSTGVITDEGLTESTGRFRVGGYGYGKLEITNGGTAQAFFTEFGRAKGSEARVLIDGYGSSFTSSDAYGAFDPDAVGREGGFIRVSRFSGSYAKVDVTNGGSLSAITDPVRAADPDLNADFPIIEIGRYIGSNGIVTIDGSDAYGNASSLNVIQYGRGNDGYLPPDIYGPLLRLGREGGEGILNITNSGVGNVIGERALVQIGRGPDFGDFNSSDQSVLTIDGGTLNVDSRGVDPGNSYEAGARVVTGYFSSGNGRLVVTGAASQLNLYSDNVAGLPFGDPLNYGAQLLVGRRGKGELLVENGGQILIDQADDAFGGLLVGVIDNGNKQGTSGSATVTGAGSSIDIVGTSIASFSEAGIIRIARNENSTGFLEISDGGRVSNPDTNATTWIGAKPTATGEVLVTGAGSLLEAGDLLVVGGVLDFQAGEGVRDGGGDGTLTIVSDGTVTADRAFIGDTGTLNISGGTLQAETTVTGAFNPGGEAAIGTANIVGDFTQEFGSVEIEVESAASHDVISITGNATIDASTVRFDLSGLGPVLAGDRMDVITATGTLDVDEAAIDLSAISAPAGHAFSLEQVGSTLSLVVDAVPAAAAFLVGLDQTVSEAMTPDDDPRFTFGLARTGSLSSALTVDFTVTGAGADPADGDDFDSGALPSGTAIFDPGSPTAEILLILDDDPEIEKDEQFLLTLSNPSDGTLVIANGEAVGTIANDDLTGDGGASLNGDAFGTDDALIVALNTANAYNGSATIDGGRYTLDYLAVAESSGAGATDGDLTLTGNSHLFVSPSGLGGYYGNYRYSVSVGRSSDAGVTSDGSVRIEEGSTLEIRTNADDFNSGGTLSGGYNNIFIGRGTDATGTVTVTGEDSTFLATGGGARISAGVEGGTGLLYIADGAYVGTRQLDVARADGQETIGYLSVEGYNSLLRLSSEFGFYGPLYEGSGGYNTIGRGTNGRGYFRVENGGKIIVDNNNGQTDVVYFRLARDVGSYGYGRISGDGSSLSLEQTGEADIGFTPDFGAQLLIGDGGQGVLIVEQGGEVSVTGDEATVSVADGRDNAGAAEESMLVVVDGGTVTVSNGGYDGGQVNVGRGLGTNGQIVVSGVGSTLIVDNDTADAKESPNGYLSSRVTIGGAGAGDLAIDTGGKLIIDLADDPFGSLAIGYGSPTGGTGTGRATVSGFGSSINIIGSGPGAEAAATLGYTGFSVGRNSGSYGSLTISDGAKVVNAPTSDGVVLIGSKAGAVGVVTVEGAGSRLDAVGKIGVGADIDLLTGEIGGGTGGTGTLEIGSDALVKARETIVEEGSTLILDDGLLKSDVTLDGSLEHGAVGGTGIGSIRGDLDSRGMITFDVPSLTTGAADLLEVDGNVDLTGTSFTVDLFGLSGVSTGESAILMEVSGTLEADASLIDASKVNAPAGVSSQIFRSGTPVDADGITLVQGNVIGLVILDDGGGGTGSTSGTAGSDILVGGSGSEVLSTGGGLLDTLFGQGGGDTFVFSGLADDGQRDAAVIQDYEIGLDVVDLQGRVVASAVEQAGETILFLDGTEEDVLTVMGASTLAEITFATP